MDTPVTVQIIAASGAILLGVWALFRYVLKSFTEQQRASSDASKEAQTVFLSHLALKNNHLERTSERFAGTLEKSHEVLAGLAQGVQHIGIGQTAMISSLDKVLTVLEEDRRLLLATTVAVTASSAAAAEAAAAEARKVAANVAETAAKTATKVAEVAAVAAMTKLE